MAAIAGFGVAAQLSRGWPGRVTEQVRALDAARMDSSPDRGRCHASDEHRISFEQKCTYGPTGTTPSTAIWGDSFAAELGYVLGQRHRDGSTLLYISYSGCGPVLGVLGAANPCEVHNREVLEKLNQSPTITKVVLIARYEMYVSRHGARFLDGFARIVEALAANKKQVVIVYPVPQPPGDVPTLLARRARKGVAAELQIARDEYERRNQVTLKRLDELVQRFGAVAVRPDSVLCDARRCSMIKDGQVLYFDDNHLSLKGAELVAPMVEAARR